MPKSIILPDKTPLRHKNLPLDRTIIRQKNREQRCWFDKFTENDISPLFSVNLYLYNTMF